MAKLKSQLAARGRNLLAFTSVVSAALGDIVAPPRCLGCLCEGTWLCALCYHTHARYPLSCIACEREHPRGLTCAQCRATTPLTGVVSVGSYRATILQRGIHWLKFKGVRAVAPLLAQLLLPRLLVIAPLAQLQREACLIPIPLHARRQRERGFNQSLDIAQHVSLMSNIPLIQPLTRAHSTWTQSHLPKELREQNMAAAFATQADLPLACKTILLLDDVTTTGSTLGAAGSALQKISPANIWGVTIARG